MDKCSDTEFLGPHIEDSLIVKISEGLIDGFTLNPINYDNLSSLRKENEFIDSTDDLWVQMIRNEVMGEAMKNNFKIRNVTEEVKSEIQSDEVQSVSSPDAINSLSKYGSFYTSNTDIEMKDVQKQ